MSKIDDPNAKCDKCNKEAIYVSELWAYCQEHAETGNIFEFERTYQPINKCAQIKEKELEED
jgi:hypothetical protein